MERSLSVIQWEQATLSETLMSEVKKLWNEFPRRVFGELITFKCCADRGQYSSSGLVQVGERFERIFIVSRQIKIRITTQQVFYPMAFPSRTSSLLNEQQTDGLRIILNDLSVPFRWIHSPKSIVSIKMMYFCVNPRKKQRCWLPFDYVLMDCHNKNRREANEHKWIPQTPIMNYSLWLPHVWTLYHGQYTVCSCH